jgi:hypothetical protein
VTLRKETRDRVLAVLTQEVSWWSLDTNDTRRRSRSSVRPEQGLEIARLVARALTVEIERRGAGVTCDPDDLMRAVEGR